MTIVISIDASLLATIHGVSHELSLLDSLRWLFAECALVQRPVMTGTRIAHDLTKSILRAGYNHIGQE
jgi:hypothetical protein